MKKPENKELQKQLIINLSLQEQLSGLEKKNKELIEILQKSINAEIALIGSIDYQKGYKQSSEDTLYHINRLTQKQ